MKTASSSSLDPNIINEQSVLTHSLYSSLDPNTINEQSVLTHSLYSSPNQRPNFTLTEINSHSAAFF